MTLSTPFPHVRDSYQKADYLPSEEEIRLECLAIQAEWEPEEFAFRRAAMPRDLIGMQRIRDRVCEGCGKAFRGRPQQRFCSRCAEHRERELHRQYQQRRRAARKAVKG